VTRPRSIPDRVIVVTERRGKRWEHPRSFGMTGMGHARRTGHRILYKVNIYHKRPA
jgi:hypothetical protein